MLLSVLKNIPLPYGSNENEYVKVNIKTMIVIIIITMIIIMIIIIIMMIIIIIIIILMIIIMAIYSQSMKLIKQLDDI